MQCISSRLILHAVWFFRKIKHYLSYKWHHGYLEYLIWRFSSNSVVLSVMVLQYWKHWYCAATTETVLRYSIKEKPTQSSWQGRNNCLLLSPHGGNELQLQPFVQLLWGILGTFTASTQCVWFKSFINYRTTVISSLSFR